MLQNLHRALGALTIAAACGGGDDGGGNGPPPDGTDEIECGDGTCDTDSESFGTCPEDCPPVVNCGNGTCDGNEDCALCATDCGACPERCGDGTCGGTENCTTCSSDCACGSDQMCREGACVARNPLIDAIPGTWVRQRDGEAFIVSDQTLFLGSNCGCTDQPPGDACFQGFQPPNSVVLSGTRIIFSGCGRTVSGEVLNGGTHVVYDWSDADGDSGHEEWEKQ